MSKRKRPTPTNPFNAAVNTAPKAILRAAKMFSAEMSAAFNALWWVAPKRTQPVPPANAWQETISSEAP